MRETNDSLIIWCGQEYQHVTLSSHVAEMNRDTCYFFLDLVTSVPGCHDGVPEISAASQL